MGKRKRKPTEKKALFGDFHLPGSRRQRVVFLVKILVLTGVLLLRRQPFVHDVNLVEGRYPLSLDSVLDAALFFLVAHLTFELLRIIIIGVYLRRHHLNFDARDNFVIGINQIASILSFFALVLGLFLALNLPVGEVLTSLSIVAAAIAILSKDYVSNMINGMILMFGNQIAIHDQVKIDSQSGQIVDITLLNVHLVSDDDDLILIPNNTVLATPVINYTKRRIKKVSLEFEIGYQYLHDADELEAFLIESLEPFQQYIQPGSMNLRTVEIRKDAAQMKFQYILAGTENKKIESQIRRSTKRQVLNYLARKTPLPQV